jgi:hypothetical protein
LYPYPLGAEDSEPVWQARFQRIIERTRLQYCMVLPDFFGEKKVENYLICCS